MVRVYSTGNITVVNAAKGGLQDTVFINAAVDVQSGGSLIMTGTGKMYLAQGGTDGWTDGRTNRNLSNPTRPLTQL